MIVENEELRGEFHVRRDAREKYGIEGPVFGTYGDTARTDLLSARRLAHTINASRDLIHHPGDAVRASDLNAMGILHAVFHEIVDLYRREYGGATISRSLDVLAQRISGSRVAARRGVFR